MHKIIPIFLSLILSQVLAAQTIKVEPPNWWFGMEVDTVQLMIHGENIAELDPMLGSGSKAFITNKSSSENPNYLWITLDLNKLTKEETVKISFCKSGKKVHTIKYHIREKPASNVKGFDQSDAIYLITPDRYANGDPSNDNIEGFEDKVDRSISGGRHGGDLAGIKRQIDYIAEMGYTTIWLNPIIENNNDEYSYHGYGSTDFYKVDRRFGSNEEYQDFVDACHKKGIKVIMDMIHNHCSVQHPWMADLPASDWLNEWSSYTETNHKKSTLQDIYAAELDKKEYLDGWFVPTMPDLNQRNPMLSTYLIQNAIWWSIYLDLDGIRMDTYSYPDKSYMQQWVWSMQKEVPQVSIVGEEWTVNPAHIAYWQKGKVNPDGFSSDLEFLMDFPTNQILSKALTEEESWDKGIGKLYESIANDFMYPIPENLLLFPDNHDMVRAYTSLGEDLNLMKMAMVFCLTIRGIPQIYYGTEILMTSPTYRDDGLIRGDYPGGWKGDTINAFTNDGLSKDQIDFKQYSTDVLQWRKSKSVIHYGKLVHFVPKDGVYVYFRYDDDDTVMVILNKNHENYLLDLSRFEQFLGNESSSGLDIIENETISLTGSLSLDPRRSYIIEVE